MKEARIIQPMQSLKRIKGVKCNQTKNEVDCETKDFKLLQEAQHTKTLKNPKATMLIGNGQKTEGRKLITIKNNPKALKTYLKITQKKIY